MAVGLDWLNDGLTTEERGHFELALIEKALSPSRSRRFQAARVEVVEQFGLHGPAGSRMNPTTVDPNHSSPPATRRIE
jgi:hypothetical protein